MRTEYLKTIINDNIKDGATTIYVKYIGLEYFIEIPVKDFMSVEFDCIVYSSGGKTIIEKEYIPVDKIVHISFQKRIEKE